MINEYINKQKVITAMYGLCKVGSFKDNPHIDDIINTIEDISSYKFAWIPVSEKPLKDGAYLVTRKTYGKPIIDTVKYAKDLYTIDKFDFADKKGQSGWYGYDSDFGYYEVTESIIAWMSLPEVYKESEE